MKKKTPDPTLLSAPPRDKREAALWKQHEAEFFLPMLKQYDHQATIEFRYMLNAFLAAVRSGHGILRDGGKKKYEAWEAKLTPHDQEILYAARAARDLAIHKDGPSLGQSEAFSYIPTPGSYKTRCGWFVRMVRASCSQQWVLRPGILACSCRPSTDSGIEGRIKAP